MQDDQYIRDIDVVKNATQQLAHSLTRARNIPYAEALVFAESKVQSTMVDPEVKALVRGDNGDRVKAIIPLSKIFEKTMRDQMPMSPSMTIYLSKNVRESILAIATKKNMNLRNSFKADKASAEIAGDTVGRGIAENKQQGRKRSNNALSGAQVSKATNLCTPTAHSSLTSTCSVTAGNGNANNEKFIAGNRHYWSPDIVLGNISSICNITDAALFQEAMETYGLVYPSVEDCWEMVCDSSKYYWDPTVENTPILDVIRGLTPLERAMVMYVGDLKHLADLNDEFVGTMIRSIANPATQPLSLSECAIVGPKIKGDLWVLTNYVGKNFVQGRKHGDLMKDEHNYGLYCATGKGTLDAIEKYSLLIRAFWTTQNMPVSVADIPTIIRRAVPASDTDSTIFTVQYWVKRYTTGTLFSDESCNIRDAIVFLCSQTIIHILAMMSTNMGIATEHRFLLGMKNEYVFPVFCVTNATKHYYAYQGAVEGIIKKEMALELKGVNLKASTSPKELVAKCHDMIREIMDATMSGKGMVLNDLLKRIADMEREIIESIRTGKATFLKRVNVKSPEGYKQLEEAPTYKAHLFWNEVFGPTFNMAPELPYRGLRFNTSVKNKTGMQDWLDRFDDQDCKKRLEDWMERTGKGMVKTIIVPADLISEYGVPDDIIKNMNVRKTISNNMSCFYVMLTAMGLMFLDKKNTKLLSDYF